MSKGFITIPLLAIGAILVASVLWGGLTFLEQQESKEQEPTVGLAVYQTVQGGTGTSSPSGILYGDSSNPLKTVTIGSNLTFSGGTLSSTASGGSGAATTSFAATYPVQVATSPSAITYSLDFGTTTANTWGAHNIFTSLFATIASTTNATTTNLHITSLTNSLLSTDGNGRVQAPSTVSDALLGSYLTRDTEWDTEAEVQTAWGSVNILMETEIDGCSELLALQ